MKTKTLSLIVAALFLTGPALAQSLSEKTGLNSALGVAPTTAEFVNQAAVSDMFEIQSSELAIQRSNPTTKAFAQQMVTAHQKTSEELKKLVADGKVKEALPTKLDSALQKKLDELRSLEGSEFTRQYHTDQVEAHKDAVSLFERYAEGGDNPALKAWAMKTLPELKQHLAAAEKLDRAS